MENVGLPQERVKLARAQVRVVYLLSVPLIIVKVTGKLLTLRQISAMSHAPHSTDIAIAPASSIPVPFPSAIMRTSVILDQR